MADSQPEFRVTASGLIFMRFFSKDLLYPKDYTDRDIQTDRAPFMIMGLIEYKEGGAANAFKTTAVGREILMEMRRLLPRPMQLFVGEQPPALDEKLCLVALRTGLIEPVPGFESDARAMRDRLAARARAAARAELAAQQAAILASVSGGTTAQVEGETGEDTTQVEGEPS
jgi:hypothetical protein